MGYLYIGVVICCIFVIVGYFSEKDVIVKSGYYILCVMGNDTILFITAEIHNVYGK